MIRPGGGCDSPVDPSILVAALARAVDADDPPERRHSETVAELCAAMAPTLGLDSVRVTEVRLAGLLHDVGTIEIPVAILNKPDSLTPEELEVIRTHPVRGSIIVEALGMARQAAWILHHHERIDGYGYPDGLTSSAIPLESRIIFVADAFEAMTARQPHRLGETASEAIARLKRHTGTQFDPDCVAALETTVAGLQREQRPDPD